MKALIVVGSDLSINSSANLCHTAYINGLLNYGCDVDVLTAGEPIELKSTDNIRHGVHYFVYPMDTLYEKAGRFIRRFRRGRTTDAASAVSTSFSEAKPASKLKRIIHSFYGPYEVYSVWGKRAKRFKSAKEYDIVISLAFPDGSYKLFEGRVDGQIALEKHGNGGFGYDPLFVPDGFAKSFAQMSKKEKNSVSHRGRAVEKLKAYLKSL